MTNVYCIGDSHVSVFLGRDMLAPLYPEKIKSLIKNFEVIRLGPILAYNFCDYNRTVPGREKFESILPLIGRDDIIVISAGEIDCRAHLIMQSKKQECDYDKVCYNLVERYLGYVKKVSQNYNICIMLPPPTSYLDENRLRNSYPVVGSESERNQMTNTLKKHMIKFCQINNIKFIDVCNTINEKMKTKKKILWDGIHYSTYVLPELVNGIKYNFNCDISLTLKWRFRESIRRIKRIVEGKLGI